MAGHSSSSDVDPSEQDYDPWFRYGVAILYVEMGIAVLVTIYSLYMAFTGSGGIGH